MTTLLYNKQCYKIEAISNQFPAIIITRYFRNIIWQLTVIEIVEVKAGSKECWNLWSRHHSRPGYAGQVKIQLLRQRPDIKKTDWQTILKMIKIFFGLMYFNKNYWEITVEMLARLRHFCFVTRQVQIGFSLFGTDQLRPSLYPQHTYTYSHSLAQWSHLIT